MCLYMSVPQWLNLQKFLKAINESINHTIDVSLMFIYFKCLNNANNKNNTNPSTKQIVKTQTNLDKNHKTDLNVNLKKINSFDKFALHKTCCEFGQMERMATTKQENKQNRQKLYQQKQQHNQLCHNINNHLPQYQQQQQQQLRYQRQQPQYQHQCSLFNQDQLLLMDKYKTLPLHI